ncbi:hAT transposon superfamily protein [Striga hermonthica]|uniref:HAT transposon superfamily protein n=1 Tax=Striga hermonthica TaxID=68872 RepID=A0A9N7N8M5_STRHE|nr:hAT transposon superfamily protein [Striga hermonthica]
MSSAASAPSPSTNTTKSTHNNLKRNSCDVGWEYGMLVDPNDLNKVQCKLCDFVVKAGIYRLKQHIAGVRGQVRPCPEAKDEDKAKCKKALDDAKKAKKAREQEQQEVRDVVVLDDGADSEDTTTTVEGVGVGESSQRKLRPMDKYTMPMDPSSLCNTKVVRQQKISEAIWKERMHNLKRYIAKWVYVHGIPFNAINNEEFDQMIEAAGRFGPSGKKPNQHELREKLLYEEVEDTKKLLKSQEEDWAKNGCSIMTDAWTDQKRRSIMNLCVNCSIGTSFLESKEASAESHTGNLIFEYVDSCIEKPSMAFLYGEILKAKKEIREGIGSMDKSVNLNLYNTIIDIIDVKMKNRLDTPLHLAAYFLNPFYSYNDSSIFANEDVMDGFISAVETFYHGDYEKQNQVLNEDLHKFKDQTGHFAKHVAMAGCKDYNFCPAKWWGNYGTQVPTLQKMAIRLLSLTSSSSGCERNWSCFEGIHTKKRNRLTTERVEQLVFVRFNSLHAKKKSKAKKNDKMDPLVATESTYCQAWMVEGGDDDSSSPEAVTGLTWEQIVETCGAEEVTKLRRSARLAQPREIEEEIESETEPESANEEEEIEFESDQDNVFTTGYEQEQEGDNDD